MLPFRIAARQGRRQPARGCRMMDLKASCPCPKDLTRVRPLEAAACIVKRTASGPVRFVSASYVKPAPHSIISHLHADVALSIDTKSAPLIQ